MALLNCTHPAKSKPYKLFSGVCRVRSPKGGTDEKRNAVVSASANHAIRLFLRPDFLCSRLQIQTPLKYIPRKVEQPFRSCAERIKSNRRHLRNVMTFSRGEIQKFAGRRRVSPWVKALRTPPCRSFPFVSVR